MPKRFEIYKCNVCGNVIEVLDGGQGEIVCCGEPMKLVVPQTEEIMQEKHKPVISSQNNNIVIKVGSVEHPMLSEHHIDFIEAVSLDGKYLYRKYLAADEKPEMEFFCKTDKMKSRELCNLHGLFETINE